MYNNTGPAVASVAPGVIFPTCAGIEVLEEIGRAGRHFPPHREKPSKVALSQA